MQAKNIHATLNTFKCNDILIDSEVKLALQ